MWILDPGGKIRIQDKHPGSATLADADMALSQGKSNVQIFGIEISTDLEYGHSASLYLL
jgi:hypothetical protein